MVPSEVVARSALQTVEALKAKGVHLHLLDLGGDIAGNGLSKLFLTIAAAFAEAERDRIRERVSQVKADQLARNRYLGGAVPFGWRVDDTGVLVEDPEQQAAIQRMIELRAAGLSLRAIAAKMNAEGFSISHVGVRRRWLPRRGPRLRKLRPHSGSMHHSPYLVRVGRTTRSLSDRRPSRRSQPRSATA